MSGYLTRSERNPRMTAFSNTACLAALLGAALPSAAVAAKKPGDDTSNPAYATTQVVIVANTSGKPAKSADFIHPGVLLNRAQLDEIRRRVASGIEPQQSAFEALTPSRSAALQYTPHPRQTFECGPD